MGTKLKSGGQLPPCAMLATALSTTQQQALYAKRLAVPTCMRHNSNLHDLYLLVLYRLVLYSTVQASGGREDRVEEPRNEHQISNAPGRLNVRFFLLNGPNS